MTHKSGEPSRRPVTGCSGGAISNGQRSSAAERLLETIGAPRPIVCSAHAYTEIDAWWSLCQVPEHLVWFASRLSAAAPSRHDVVQCVAVLSARAAEQLDQADPRLTAAVSGALAWPALVGGADLTSVTGLAFRAASDAGATAEGEAARAGRLFAGASHHRLASSGMARAIIAHHRWRSARQLHLAAMAVVETGLAAARADSDEPIQWAVGTTRATGYALQAMLMSEGARAECRIRRRCADIVRGHLACPAVG